MKTKSKIDLYHYNTMRLHCIADEVLCPESDQELFDIVKRLNQERKSFKVLGAGSNVVLPKRLKDAVIMMNEMPAIIEVDNNIVRCSSRVRIQQLIRTCQKSNLGGIEYLFSVPCSVGWAIYMNAGRGNRRDSISNYVVSVECLNLKTGQKEVLRKDDCDFAFRSSVFFNKERIILNVFFCFDTIEASVIEEKIKERMAYSKENLDAVLPSCGSVFCEFNGRIMSHLRGFKIGGARFSPKTTNWISNYNDASNYQIRWLIKLAVLMHKIAHTPYRIEVEIW